MRKKIIFSFFILLLSCNNRDSEIENIETLTIDILPFSDISKKVIDSVYFELKNVYPNINLLNPIPLPQNVYYAPRNRYRADSLIRFLRKITPKNHVTIGLTSKDISHTKGNIQDYGIMGLGWSPGNSCIVSTYRLSKENKNTQFFKFCLHELGHTTGLPHCEIKTCFMRDAEGGNPTNEEIDFCEECKTHLISKGWTFKKENK